MSCNIWTRSLYSDEGVKGFLDFYVAAAALSTTIETDGGRERTSRGGRDVT